MKKKIIIKQKLFCWYVHNVRVYQDVIHNTAWNDAQKRIIKEERNFKIYIQTHSMREEKYHNKSLYYGCWRHELNGSAPFMLATNEHHWGVFHQNSTNEWKVLTFLLLCITINVSFIEILEIWYQTLESNIFFFFFEFLFFKKKLEEKIIMESYFFT